MKYDYDLFVIGGGSGGVRAARIAAQHGAKVALAEEYRMGGTCVIRGCVPKKLMVYASDYAKQIKNAKGFGYNIGAVDYNHPEFMTKLRNEVTRLSGLYMKSQHGAGVKVYECRASLQGDHAIRLETTGETVTAAKILVAVGGKPWAPEKAGSDLAITSDDVFDLDQIPQHLAIIGSGYIALEFAHVFAGLGAKVTVVFRGEHVLRGFDSDVQQITLENLQQAGIRCLSKTEYTSITEQNGTKIVPLTNGETLEVDQILMATGRRPYSDGLGLETAGVQTARNGAIIVDKYSKTNVDYIWAVGDVTDRINLTPVAIREGHAFADTEFGGNARYFDHENVASAVFVQPEIGTVGLTEAQAREGYGDAVTTYKTNFRPLKNAINGDWTKYFFKLICTGPEETVRGVHIIGEGAAEMIQMVGIAVKMGATKAQFDATCAVHPTAAEELVTLK